MKYETIGAFVNAAKEGQFTGYVIVDNDCVSAYEGEEEVCDFDGCGPEGSLISVLKSLGVHAEPA